MLEILLSGTHYGTLGLMELVASTVASLVFGLAVSWVYRFRNKYSQSLAVTLVILPALVQIIIMLASGNIGVGVAVAGAFSLIRFRSVPGNARDIGHLFLSMALGFVTGLGYLFYALVFLAITGSASLLLTALRFGQEDDNIRILHIKIPENLDYEGLFDEVFQQYTSSAELQSVRTSQMGSLYELTYAVQMKSASSSKAFIDDLRIRNGNLNIMLSRKMRNWEEL
jgi:hypothetical protein